MLSNHTYVTGVWLLEPKVILWKGRKLGWKEGAWPHQQSCASRTPISNQVLTARWKSTGSLQTIPQNPHSFHKTKIHTTAHYPHKSSPHSCVGGATPPPLNHTHFTPLLPFLRPHSPHNHTGVLCPINCHGLTSCQPRRHLVGIKGHGDTPSYRHGTFVHLNNEAAMSRPTEAFKAHTHTHSTKDLEPTTSGLNDFFSRDRHTKQK